VTRPPREHCSWHKRAYPSMVLLGLAAELAAAGQLLWWLAWRG
jgi:hypothetical protein